MPDSRILKPVKIQANLSSQNPISNGSEFIIEQRDDHSNPFQSLKHNF